MRKLSAKAKAYILGTIFVGIGLFAWELTNLDWGQIWHLLALGALASLSLILKVQGTTERSHYNISFLVYAFTFVLLGVPAAMFVILFSNLVEWAWHKYPWYIQSFNIANYMIAIQFASWVYLAINPAQGVYNFIGVIGLLAAMAAFTLLNHLLIGLVVWLARGENFAKSGIFDILPLMIDFTLMCMGALAAILWVINPFAVVFTILPLYLIYSTLKVPALERKSDTDPKTGLFNVRYFEHALQSELARANRFDRPMTIVMADLDLLRNINNTYGHLAGDQVLIGMAEILKKSVRDYDILARFGGEEFSILMPETTTQDAYLRIEEIRETIENAEFNVQTSVTPIRVTMSFGIAGRQGFAQTPNDIVHNADAALYHAKLSGRNRAFVYSDAAYDSVFGNVHRSAQPEGNASMEARIQMSEMPYEPSSLREEPGMIQAQAEEIPSQSITQAPATSPWLVKAFIASLALISLAMFGMLYQPLQTLDWVGLAFLVLMVVLTEWMSIEIYVRDTSVSTSAAPMLAGTLLFGPLGVLVLSLTFAITALVKHRSAVSRLIFNFSNQMLGGMLVVVLLTIFRQTFLQLPVLTQFVVSLLGAGIVYLSTTIMVSLVIRLDLGAPFQQTWKEKFAWLMPYYLSMGLIAYAFYFSYVHAGLIGLLATSIPLVLIRLGQKQYIDRTRVIVSELKEKNLILERNAAEINRLNEGLLEALAEVIDLRDPYVLGHSKQVANYAVMIAQKLHLPPQQVELVRKAGLLHDIGKLGIPESILTKPGKLTADEYQLVRRHTTLGAEILEKSHALRSLIPIVRHHHEYFNGKGYPDGLSGNEIPIEARIMGVADAVEAMASDRPYRTGLSLENILRELEQNAGTQFDPVVVHTFLQLVQSKDEQVVRNLAGKYSFEVSLPGGEMAEVNITSREAVPT
jgi:diguanylate cyclase (GGDEF)-like protein/putative nucleotidyltransferase with HDIG domain